MEFTFINEDNRNSVTSFIEKQWLTTKMVIRGNIIDMTKVDGIVLNNEEGIIALITFIIRNDICEITSLDSLYEGKGIATKLIEKTIAFARQKKCEKVIVVTTNDNINAIRFYQKRGFDMARFYHNALNVSRKLKSQIPIIGDNGIPLQHEIEFEYCLKK